MLLCITMVMSSLRFAVRGNIVFKSILFAFAYFLLIPSSLIGDNDYFVMPPGVAYSQSDTKHTKPDVTESTYMLDMPTEKVRVGDIDIAYRMFGSGEPILLISGASAGIGGWDPSTLRSLSSNHTVVVFDGRGVGNTSMGSKPFSIQQLANDAAGLLDALNIQNTHVLGYSLGGHIAQQFAIEYPDKVNGLVLVATTCGGKDGVPKPHQVIKLQSEIVNKSLNGIPITEEEITSLMSFSLGLEWIRMHPESIENIPDGRDLFAIVSPHTVKQQFDVGMEWEATNWNGACDDLAKMAKPTLVITGTDDHAYMPHVNSLIIAGKIPGAWLVQIKDAGHAVTSQYPEKINRTLQTFLSTTTSSATTAAQPG